MEFTTTHLLVGLLSLTGLIVITVLALRLSMRYRKRCLLKGAPSKTTLMTGQWLRTKYADVDETQYRHALLLFGVAVSLSIAILTINWTQYVKPVFDLDASLFDEELITIEP